MMQSTGSLVTNHVLRYSLMRFRHVAVVQIDYNMRRQAMANEIWLSLVTLG